MSWRIYRNDSPNLGVVFSNFNYTLCDFLYCWITLRLNIHGSFSLHTSCLLGKRLFISAELEKKTINSIYLKALEKICICHMHWKIWEINWNQSLFYPGLYGPLLVLSRPLLCSPQCLFRLDQDTSSWWPSWTDGE